jgi:alpha-ribazole phosphatase/probable phosphoglycerate mutase
MGRILRIIYLVHGTTTDNENSISSGWKDAPLSALGRKQSIELKTQLAGKSFDAVFCSDLQRATESARLTFDGIARIIPDARLRECNYGSFNGKPSVVVEPMQEQSISVPFTGGESYEDVKERVASLLESLKKDYAGKHVAFVSHKAPQLALEVLLNGKSWAEAFEADWRKTGKWKPGWEYAFEYK